MADRRCWKCKQPFGPFERPMDFTYDGTTITRHDDCVSALMRGIEAAVEAVRGLVEAVEALRDSENTERRPDYARAFADDDLLGSLFQAASAAKEVLGG